MGNFILATSRSPRSNNPQTVTSTMVAMASAIPIKLFTTKLIPHNKTPSVIKVWIVDRLSSGADGVSNRM
jgi:hypothetical protein